MQSQPDVRLTLSEALSGISGSISLCCWIFLLVPQLLKNYRQQSGDGLSKHFLAIWLVGDILNLSGALMAGLVPTIVLIGVYFTFADLVLILQVLYYDVKSKKTAEQLTSERLSRLETRHAARRLTDRGPPYTASEQDQLLAAAARRPQFGYSAAAQIRRQSGSSTTDSLSSGSSEGSGRAGRLTEFWSNTIAITGICVAGTVGWYLAYRAGLWKPVPAPDADPTFGADAHRDGSRDRNWADFRADLALVLGYSSAVVYLAARLPQIYKNQQERSCEGLSLLFFMLSALGNFSYAGGIIAHSVDPTYIWTNLPWIIGSLGTITEDLVIFAQFRVFGVGKGRARLIDPEAR